MFITRHALANAGLEVNLDENGLSIQGTEPLPQGMRKHVKAIGIAMNFDPIDHDELMDHIVNVGVWKALRGCRTEI